MFIPKNVRVGGVNYNVIEQPFIECGGDRNYQGMCSFSDTEISLLADLSRERKSNVFIHELTHAIFYEAGFEEHDEDMINRVGNVLHQVLTDNDLFLGGKNK